MFLHVVDLDGAFSGKLTNASIIGDICEAVDIPVEVGGGIRSEEAIETYLEAGVNRVIIGSKAVEDPEFITAMAKKYGSSLAVSIDAKGDVVATRGWVDGSDKKVLPFAQSMLDIGINTLVYTDISRDGMLTGPNFEMLSQLQQLPFIRLIASGGMSSIADLKKLQAMGVYGAITGKALYEGQNHDGRNPRIRGNVRCWQNVLYRAWTSAMAASSKASSLNISRTSTIPSNWGKFYSDQLADELVFYDITATHEKRHIFIDVVRAVAEAITIPFTIGGGISSIDDFHQVLRAGADKVSVNSAAVRRPELIREAAQRFGSQCVVLSIDAKRDNHGSWQVYVEGGRKNTGIDAIAWAKQGVALGAGEICMNSMDADGEKGRLRPGTEPPPGDGTACAHHRFRRCRHDAGFQGCLRRRRRCRSGRFGLPLRPDRHPRFEDLFTGTGNSHERGRRINGKCIDERH